MNNTKILNLLSLTMNDGSELKDIIVEDIDTINDTKRIIISKKPSSELKICPTCGFVMYSKGYYHRKIKHPVLQDGYKLIIYVRQKKYRCTNKDCNLYLNEEFGFIEKNKQTTTITPYLILNDLKDITQTCASIARRYHLSDTYIHSIILRYLDFSKLGLAKVISIDEVYIDIEYDSRYCVIIRDFTNDNIIDILPNRNHNTLKNYFMSYSKEEREKVMFVVSDMYDEYINLNSYLPNSESIIDSFHIILFISHKIREYMNKVKRKYRDIDNQRREELNYQTNRYNKTIKECDELYIMNRYEWALFSKIGNEPFIDQNKYNRRLHRYINTRIAKDLFMAIDTNFPIFKQLLDMYYDFNDSCIGKPKIAKEELKKLIELYKNNNHKIFNDFAHLLEKHFNRIIASFNTVTSYKKDGSEYQRRISNGPIESFNRSPKDMKRLARGFSNFTYVRNRLIWTYRKEAHPLAVPKTIKEVHKPGKLRGKYNKN